MDSDAEHEFGGSWTELKLDAISDYLSFYTAALRYKPRPDRPFVLWYVDAFAGSGERTSTREIGGLLEGRPSSITRVQLDGSAKRAIAIAPPFHHLRFIEENKTRFAALKKLELLHPNRDVQCLKGDANAKLAEIFTTSPWAHQVGGRGLHRAVVFLDPYAMSVKWSTLELLAMTRAVDVWYLFPLHAVVRQMSHDFDAVDEHKSAKLNEIFGTTAWAQELYQEPAQTSLWDEPVGRQRIVTVAQIEAYAKRRLESLFTYVSDPLPLLTDRGAQLFSLFCASASSSDAARQLIQKGVSHVLKKYRPSASRRRSGL